MRHFNFVLEEHEEYGTEGFRPLWITGADPIVGSGVPHDILEHGYRHAGGTVDDELRALGAVAYIRGDSDHFTSHAMPEWSQHVSGDIGFMFRDFVVEDKQWVGTRDLVTRRVDNDYFEEQLEALVPRMIKEAHDYLNDSSEAEDNDDMVALYFDGPHCAVITGLIRQGYRQAVRDYGYFGAYATNQVFKDMERRANNLLNQGDGLIGDKMLTRFDRKTLEWDMRLVGARHD